MKNITKQYQDLLEGKMSKDNFMRSVRRDFPQWISPVNSFGDAVSILKSKRILSEGIDLSPKATAQAITNLNKQVDRPEREEEPDEDERDADERGAQSKEISMSETSAGGFHKGAPMGGPSGIRIGGKQRGGEPRKDENIFNTAQMGGILDNPQSGRTSSLERMIDDLKTKHPGVDLKPFLSKYNIHQKNSTAPEVYLPAFDDYMDNEMVTQMQSKRAGEFDPNNPGKHSTLEGMTEVSDDTVGQDIKRLLAKGHSYEEVIAYLAAELEIEPDELENEYPRDVVDIEGHGDLEGPEDGEYVDNDEWWEPLYEAVQKPEGAYKNVTGKAEYDKFAEMDRVDYRQLMKGTEFELLKMPEITDENLVKAKTKAYKALIKNPKAYMHLVTANANEVEKKDKDLRMQPVKGDNKVDKANAMKVIKKDEGSNTQTNLSNKEKAKGNPKGVKEMPDKGVIGTEKVLRESLVRQLREHILDEMMEVGTKQTTHNKGDVVKKKDGKVGTVREVSSDNTCEVVYEDGSVEEIQGNVLEKHTGAQIDEFEVGDNAPFQAWSREKKGKEQLKQATNSSGETFEIGNTATAPDGKKIKITGFRVGVDGHTKASYMDGLSAEEYDLNQLEKDKNAALKERLVKSLKKEAGIVQSKQGGVTIASGKNDAELTTQGKSIERSTGEQLVFVNPKTGQKKDI